MPLYFGVSEEGGSWCTPPPPKKKKGYKGHKIPFTAGKTPTKMTEEKGPSLTWRTMVPIQMPMKTGFRCNPSMMLCCSWILRALISLKRVIMTKVLKMMVKCWLGRVCSFWASSIPSSMPNSLEPAHKHPHMIRAFSVKNQQTIWGQPINLPNIRRTSKRPLSHHENLANPIKKTLQTRG